MSFRRWCCCKPKNVGEPERPSNSSSDSLSTASSLPEGSLPRTSIRSAGSSASSFHFPWLDRSKTSQNPTQSASSSKEEEFVCGFRTVPEIATIDVEAANIAPFSLPMEVLHFQPKSSTIMTQFPNGDTERMIHLNVQLSDGELKRLELLQKEAQRSCRRFFPSIAVMATRFLELARGDVPKALEKMQAAQSWKLQYFQDGPITDTSIRDDLSHGVVYFAGRDDCLRPLLVLRPARAPSKMFNDEGAGRLKRMIIFCMEYFLRFMALPGQVENLCVLVDLKGLALSQVPLGALQELRVVLTSNYPCRLGRLFICNMPWALRTLATVAQAAMSERQKMKIAFARELWELHGSFALQHLEEDFGGLKPLVDQFFPFPLAGGPFAHGCRTGLGEREAAHDAHRVLTAKVARGWLWNPVMGTEENLLGIHQCRSSIQSL